MRTADLTGAALDWAVAKCEGWEAGKYMMSPDIRKDAKGRVIGILVPNNREYMWFAPSTDWSQGGPLIERETIAIEHGGVAFEAWIAKRKPCEPDSHEWVGPTPLIAAMRCFVASRLGGEVDVPEGLV